MITTIILTIILCFVFWSCCYISTGGDEKILRLPHYSALQFSLFGIVSPLKTAYKYILQETGKYFI